MSLTVIITVSGSELTVPSFTINITGVIPDGRVITGLAPVAVPPSQLQL